MFPRPFFVLYVAVFVGTLGISMVSPLLPVYAEDLGATGIWIGLTFSAFAITQVTFGPFTGRLSDRYGRKPFIVAGLVIYMFAALGYMTADSFWQVMAFRALSGVGTGLIFSVARAYVGDMVPRGHEGRWFGLFSTADIVGFGSGPVIAGLLRATFGFNSVFIAMASLMALSAIIVFTLLPKTPPRPKRPARGGVEGEEEEAVASSPVFQALRDRLVLAVTLNQAFVSLSFGSVLSFLAVRLEDDLGAGPALVGIAFGMQNLANGISQPFMGRIIDTYDRRWTLSIGVLVSASLLFCLGLATTIPMVLILLLAMGGGQAIAWTSAAALQVVAGRRVGMGTVLGLGSSGSAAGILFGSAVGGLLVDIFSLSAAFYFGAIVMACGVPVFLFLTRGIPLRDDIEDEPGSDVPPPPDLPRISTLPAGSD